MDFRRKNREELDRLDKRLENIRLWNRMLERGSFEELETLERRMMEESDEEEYIVTADEVGYTFQVGDVGYSLMFPIPDSAWVRVDGRLMRGHQ